MGCVVSVERVEMTLANTTETVTVNLSKGQDETKCVPFATMRRVLVSGTGQSDQCQYNHADIEIIDNSGTPAVRCTVDAMAASNSLLVSVYVVEFGADITVQQGAFDIVASATTDLVAVTTVDQTKAFMVHHHSCAPADADGHDEAVTAGFFSANNELTFQRGLGPSGSAVNGHWYIAEDTESNWTVESWDFDTGTAFSATISAVTMAKTFIVASMYHTHAVDDIVREWVFELTATTTVSGDVGSQDGGHAYGFAVEFDSGGDENVYRGSIEGTSGSGSEAHTAVDADFASVWCPKRHPSGMANTGGNASSDYNQGLVGYVLNGTDNGVVMTRSTAQGGTQSIRSTWETIEWAEEAAAPAGGPPVNSLALVGLGV